jgi:alpha-galactosidase
MGIKISIIGAGSHTFSLSLVRDICLTPDLKDSLVSLMDIDEERLRGVHDLCARYAKEVGLELRLEMTTDRRRSLQGADFVINTALSAGGHQRLLDGWSVAMEHGYRFGGSYHIVHDEAFWINFPQLRLMESILQDMEEVCPKAWYLLVANPVSAGITYLQRKYSHMKTVGLCHGSGMVYHLAETLGLDKTKISFELPGVNHFLWLTSFRYKGEDAFPILDRWIEEKGKAHWESCETSDYEGPKPFDLYKRFGAFPIGDTANPGGGAWPFWYHSDDATEKAWREDPLLWYQKSFENAKTKVARINGIAADPSKKVTDEFPPVISGEPMVPIIESIAFDKPKVIIVNMLNEGEFVPGLPRDFQVEIPALVGGGGIQGIRTHGLPKTLTAYILRDRIAPVEMELAAFEQRDKTLLLSLIMMDPFTKSEKQAEALLDDILSLPINREMKGWYR